ncbi:MAG: hypoxanthine phosphoribosyltransferase [Planctomycetes bacterium]|nr:hypoxanthine phosphoribosyltransferase [Planctomycetota bacterium]
MVYDRIIITQEEIQNCVLMLSKEITATYETFDNLVIIVVLNGAKQFAKDLIRVLGVDLEIEYIRASSYHGGIESCRKVEIEGSINSRLSGKSVLIIDDIYDSGITLNALLCFVRGYNPKDIKTCVLLEKDIRHEVQIPVDYIGLTVEDSFLVGYGLDYQNNYRDLPFIATLNLHKIGESQMLPITE